jgi:predicted membrane protein
MFTHTSYNNTLDYIDSVAVFGSVKKTVISKNFQGGNVHSVFGAVDIDLSQADIQGVVVLDISQAFSEVKLLVPKNWRVEADLSHFCSATDDKRFDLSQTRDSEKVLVITGISGFAAVNIRSL